MERFAQFFQGRHLFTVPPVNSDIPRVKTTRLFFDQLSVDFSSCNIVIPRECHGEVPLVIPRSTSRPSLRTYTSPGCYIKPNLVRPLGPRELTVLRGPHRTRIDVHIRINLDRSDLEPQSLEQQPGGRSCISRQLLRTPSLDNNNAPMTPLPMPLTTPPDTRMYFVISVLKREEREITMQRK